MSTHAEIGSIPTLTVGWRIRMAREFAGLDQGQLAERTQIARNTISNYENGATTRVKPLYLRQIALATGVSLDWLLGEVTGGQPAYVGGHVSDERIAA